MALGAGALVFALAAFGVEVHVALSSSSESTCTSSEEMPEPRAGVGLLQTKSSRAGAHQAPTEPLPEALRTLGVEAFGSAEALDNVLAESQEANISYAGIPLVLRFLAKDNAAWRLGQKSEDGSDYGLNSLLDIRPSKDDMVNMIDMGGNNGLVTIAVYKKYAGLVRAVVTEPISATYFFMLEHVAEQGSLSHKGGVYQGSQEGGSICRACWRGER